MPNRRTTVSFVILLNNRGAAKWFTFFATLDEISKGVYCRRSNSVEVVWIFSADILWLAPSDAFSRHARSSISSTAGSGCHQAPNQESQRTFRRGAFQQPQKI